MKKTTWIIIIILLLIFGFFFYLLATRQMTVPFLYRIKASNSYTLGTIKTATPLDIEFDSIKVIPSNQFDVHPPFIFLADPFVIQDEDNYYIFFEEFSSKMNSTWGDIGVIKSSDLVEWEYLGTVLDEPFHLSFPNVFLWNDQWYMIPETGGANEIRIYSTENFPYDWKYQCTLIKDLKLSDPILIFGDDIYLLGMNIRTQTLEMYMSEDLFSHWELHPSSPIRVGSDSDIRPAGRPLYYNNELYYFIQDHTEGYGTGVISYKIDSISSTFFQDTRLDDNPLLYKNGSGWASNGMHHFSCIHLNDSSFFCVTDGAEWHGKSWGIDFRNFPKFRFKN